MIKIFLCFYTVVFVLLLVISSSLPLFFDVLTPEFVEIFYAYTVISSDFMLVSMMISAVLAGSLWLNNGGCDVSRKIESNN